MRQNRSLAESTCPPVLALHAAASSGVQWEGLADYLGGRYSVFAPDLPGYGDASSREAADIADTAEQLVSAIAANGGSAHIVGHSLGAAIALEIAIARPDLVCSLTLIEPMAFQLLCDEDRSDMELYQELSRLADSMVAAIANRNHVAAMQGYVDYWYGAGAWNRTSAQLRAELARDAGRAARDLGRSLVNTQLARRCRELSCPALLMMALHSPLASLRVTELVARAIPAARLLMIPDAGHMAPLTDPHVINPLICMHLNSANRVDAGGRSEKWATIVY
ncbi:alpha/beta fold hydrolase [Mesorhizobium xinjiangense]|uniref:alpha/beta fold hydrolase n=1 Tax=Mesorhizobium xinjiangense TaxID=2678685 RepID=UPI0012EDA285|nr:alpha/beta fold hydrolase [Mesorhizobium xinjiangense]